MAVIRVVVQIDLILITIVVKKSWQPNTYQKNTYRCTKYSSALAIDSFFSLEGLNVSIKQNYIQYRTKYIQLLTQWEQNHVNPNLLLLTRFMKKVMIHISIMVGSSFVPDNRLYSDPSLTIPNQDLKYSLRSVENTEFLCHSDFTWNEIKVGESWASKSFITSRGSEVWIRHFCTFWRLKSTKLTQSRAPKMANLELLDSPKLISRKIWVAERSCNFHTVIWGVWNWPF